MLVSASAEPLHVLRVMLDTPSNEGDQRGGAAVQGGSGGRRRRADGEGGGQRLEDEPADVARVAGAVRGRRAGGACRPLPPAGALSPPDGCGAGGPDPRDAARKAVLGPS